MIEGPRAAKPEELQKAVELVDEVFLSRRKIPLTMREIFPHVFCEENIQNIRVIVEDGRPISHIALWEGELLLYGIWLRVGFMGSVCTHPDYRGRGYATLLVRDSLSKMRDDGVELVLISGFRDLYVRAGCLEAGWVYHYRIERGELKPIGGDLEITMYETNDLPDLVEIYQREPVRYRRNLNEFRLLVERGINSNVPLSLYIARRAGRPVAYASTGLFPDGEDELNVFEYAGSREAVIKLVRYIQDETGVRFVCLDVPHQDHELLSLLELQGLEKPPSQAQASMSIINPKSFLEKVKPYLEERTERRIRVLELRKLEERANLIIDRDEVLLERPEALTQLFFGAPDRLRYSGQPRMRVRGVPRYLRRALPLPTPTYGLNYL